ncbi:DNA-binding response regulator [Phytoactinopolyspora alkaliphila]|uniref:DNA-binding response regulator n=1 Tax=Phytoactinopolyspora alkaliphila TaxID=1783498 RepID=A0A6N9YQW1_9ACTN|nr:LuxR C-terminal-related transcriptional regulator [Phytoactinopolyspora alkaliphila]NED97337.1 DNA-binding response regulator [Phytoactinopolyspora alkaliphila]
MTADQIARGREAYERYAWSDAYKLLSAAEEQTGLEPNDLERLAMSAYLTGRDDAAVAGLERAHRAFLACSELGRAVRCAFWLGMVLMQRGQHAQGGGWLARGQRVLEESSLDCVEQGYLLVPVALHALGSGDPNRAHATLEQIAEIADRFGDADLIALGRLGRGQASVAMGDAVAGTAMLDEAMVAVTSGDVSPIAAGIVYCAVIIACRNIFDLRRAQEWTATLSRWCASQQDLKPYRGQCLVHRSEIMQLRGEWSDAMAEAQRACEHLSDPPGDPVVGMALYQRAELHRLRGEFARAEKNYREASVWGHPVHPGLALLWFEQGKKDAAAAAIRRVAAEAGRPVDRARILAAHVEISLATSDVGAARGAADELATIAAGFRSPYMRAVAGSATGSVLLAEGDSVGACVALREAWTAWHELDAPYEGAVVRMLMARACARLGDHDTAEMELDAARRVFAELGAEPALAKASALSRRAASRGPCGLSPREVEVLRLVATGATSREIADTLVISEKTVSRHLSNMFTKLGVSTRAAATAYAYEHQLL